MKTPHLDVNSLQNYQNLRGLTIREIFENYKMRSMSVAFIPMNLKNS